MQAETQIVARPSRAQVVRLKIASQMTGADMHSVMGYIEHLERRTKKQSNQRAMLRGLNRAYRRLQMENRWLMAVLHDLNDKPDNGVAAVAKAGGVWQYIVDRAMGNLFSIFMREFSRDKSGPGVRPN